MQDIKILLVEDENIVAKYIEKQLSDAGYKLVETVASGEKAIEKVIALKPDIVLMDIKIMGVMDGIETADHIRKNYKIPVIYLTSLADDESFQRAKMTEPFGYLIKPIDVKEFNRVVDMALYKNKIYKELIDTKKRFHIASEAAKTRVWELWADDNKLIINSELAPLFGYDEKYLQAMGKNRIELVYEEDRELVQKTIQDCFEGKTENFEIEHRIIAKNGEINWLHLRGVFVPADNEKPARIIGSATDITDRKKYEQQLINYANELKLLNASKDKFFSIISHDLRTPFNSLLGITEFIAQSYDEMSPKEIRESISNLYQSSQKVYNLILNLFEWTRLQTDRFDIEKSNLNLNEIVTETINLFKQNAELKKIKLYAETSDDISVYADKYMIEAVLRNLISNALKFTYTGGTVKVITKLKGNVAEVVVADNGVGINSKNQEKLFRIDIQFRSDGTADEKGTGLGLILCKEFVEKNNGTISVKSEEGKGSEFKVTLPLAKV